MTHHTLHAQAHHRATQAGFTLVEMLTVIAIVLIVLAIPFVSTVTERRNTMLDTGQASVIQALKTARTRAEAGAGSGPHGVHIGADKVTIFEGASYPGSGQDIPLPPGVGTDSEGTDIVFERLSGDSVAESISVEDVRGETRAVTITDHGFIE